MMDADEPSKGWPSAPAPAPPGIYGAFPPPYYQQPANAFYPNTANIQYSANHPTQNSVHLAGQSLVVTTQPMMIVPRMQVQDYLGYSIFTMLCCFLPVGIAALVFSLQTRDANTRGDITQAQRSSRTALTLNNVALGLGIAITIAWGAYVIFWSVAFTNHFISSYNG